jgi:hypothetical protein
VLEAQRLHIRCRTDGAVRWSESMSHVLQPSETEYNYYITGEEHKSDETSAMDRSLLGYLIAQYQVQNQRTAVICYLVEGW